VVSTSVSVIPIVKHSLERQAIRVVLPADRVNQAPAIKPEAVR
jgi:hypothetical protein